jgi:hypothetical protein
MENYVILHARNPYDIDMSVLEVRMKGHLNLHNILNLHLCSISFLRNNKMKERLREGDRVSNRIPTTCTYLHVGRRGR